MKSNRESVDVLLRNTEVPEFSNNEHQARLRLQIIQCESDTAETHVPPKHRMLGRPLAWVAAALCVAVALSFVLLPTKGVWAKAVSAMAGARSAIITTYRLADGQLQVTPETPVLAVSYLQEPGRFALVSSGRKGWLDDDTISVYDSDSNKLTKMRSKAPATIVGLVLSSPFSGRLLAPQYDHETDRGIVTFEGRTLRLLELSDRKDPTEKQEVYLEPESLRIAVQITWNRDAENLPWKAFMRADYAFDVPIDPKVFVLDYPPTAEVVEQEAPPEPSASETQAAAIDWTKDALAIARHGDKYVAITDVWMGEEGWVGLKIHSNLYSPMDHFLDVNRLPAFLADPAVRQRWPYDEQTLRNYLFGGKLTADNGQEYLANNGRMAAPNNRVGRDCEFSMFYHPYPVTLEHADPKTLTFRLISIVTDMKRGESMSHYGDWRENPEKYQLFELTVPVPPPSVMPPAGFKEWDIEWWAHTEVSNTAVERWVNAMRMAGRDAEVYEQFKNASEEIRLFLGTIWLLELSEYGTEADMADFFEKYQAYAVKKYGDRAEEYLKHCREIMARKPKN